MTATQQQPSPGGFQEHTDLRDLAGLEARRIQQFMFDRYRDRVSLEFARDLIAFIEIVSKGEQ